MPFLDADKISEEIHYVLTTPYELKMAEEWEAFIIEAQEEWAKLEAWRPLRGIEEQSSGKDEGSDDSLASNEGNLILTSPLGCFVLMEERPDLPMPGCWFKRKAQTDSQAPKSTTTKEDIEELHAAFDVLSEHMVETCQGGQFDVLEVPTFLGASIAEVVDALDGLNRRARHTKEFIGDVEALQVDMGEEALTLVGAVREIISPYGPPQKDSEMQENVQDLARKSTMI